MKLENEIKQTTFRNEYHKAGINLILTSGWVIKKYQDFFDTFNLTYQQYNVLRILKGQHPSSISTSEIKARMLDKNSDASRIVDRLANKSLICKKQCPKDRRLVDVAINNNGLELLDRMDIHIENLDRVLDCLTTEDASKLNLLLDKIRGCNNK